MKRILTFVLAAMLLVAVASPAFAAGPVRTQAGSSFGPGECADGDQTATREQLRECDGPLAGDCTQAQVQAQAQTRTQERTYAGETLVEADQLQLQERDMLKDGTGDGEPDQTQERVQAGADTPEDGWKVRLAGFARRIAEEFACMFGRA